MSAGLFKHYPRVPYLQQNAVSLLVSTRIKERVFKNPYAFLKYTVKEGETAESIAVDVYGSPLNAWIVYFSNDIVDPYNEWPKEFLEFEQYIKEKYGSIPIAKNTILHYENSAYDFTINTETYLKYSNADYVDSSITIDRTGWTAVDAYEFENRANEEKRNIELLDAIYLPIVEEELRNELF